MRWYSPGSLRAQMRATRSAGCRSRQFHATLSCPLANQDTPGPDPVRTARQGANQSSRAASPAQKTSDSCTEVAYRAAYSASERRLM